MVTNIWFDRSHAWHMAERFLHGYPIEGKWHHPPIEVVSAYVDQVGKDDLSRDRAKEFGFTIYPNVAEALRCGTDRLAVDAVLIIGEHGKYPRNEYGQTLYPRYEFFKQIVDVFAKDGRTAPVFNDKHLSWKWEWAKEMVDTARAMKFPFLAGSSLPVTWRMPAIDLPFGAEVEEFLCVAFGGLDSYDFHALETIQCMAERRHGGETGVAPCAYSAANRSGRLWPWGPGPTAARTRACSKRACAGARRWPSRRPSAIAIRPSRRCRNGSSSPWRIASNTPTDSKPPCC